MHTADVRTDNRQSIPSNRIEDEIISAIKSLCLRIKDTQEGQISYSSIKRSLT